jgi:hypothetical protein
LDVGIKTSVSEGILFKETAKEMWDHLATLYARGNDAKYYQLEIKVRNLKQGSMSITEYYNKLQPYEGGRN